MLWQECPEYTSDRRGIANCSLMLISLAIKHHQLKIIPGYNSQLSYHTLLCKKNLIIKITFYLFQSLESA